MFKRILVSIDASEYSRHALSIAVELAEKFNSEIELLHVIEPLDTGMSFLHYSFSEEQIDHIGQKVIDATLEGIDVGNVTIIKKIVTGHPASVIIDESKTGIDLLVMGTRGHGPLAGAVIGSKTQSVLGNTKVPVLVVK